MQNIETEKYTEFQQNLHTFDELKSLQQHQLSSDTLKQIIEKATQQQSNLLVNQQMRIQINYLVKVVLLFICWTFIFAFGYCYFAFMFSVTKLYNYSIIFIPILVFSGVMIIIIQNIGKVQESHNCCFLWSLYICFIILHSCFFASLAIALISVMPKYENKIIYDIFLIEIFGIGVSTLIILIYLLTIPSKLQYKWILIFQIIYLIPLSKFAPSQMVYMPMSSLYSVLLLRAMKQVQIGKYNLQISQVFAGMWVIYQSILIPF